MRDRMLKFVSLSKNIPYYSSTRVPGTCTGTGPTAGFSRLVYVTLCSFKFKTSQHKKFNALQNIYFQDTP